jgi:eukaryotic-like serine/threonine-protein kinase
MGEVYRAHDPRLKREVALKILPPAVADDPIRRQRFEQEARAVATLNHPNIMAIYDIGSENGILYIVTELVDGESLSGAHSACDGRWIAPCKSPLDWRRPTQLSSSTAT